MARDGLVERLAQGAVERGRLDRPDVADVARVGRLLGAGRTTSSPIFLPSVLGTNATLALRPGICDSAVVLSAPRIWSMLPTAMPGVDRLLDVLDHPGAVQRLGDDRVELARRDRVLELLRLGRRVEVRVEDGQLGVAGGGRGLGRGEHRGVVAVGDRERQVGDLEGLLVERSGRPTAAAALAAVAARPRSQLGADDAALPLQAARIRLTPSRPARRFWTSRRSCRARM